VDHATGQPETAGGNYAAQYSIFFGGRQTDWNPNSPIIANNLLTIFITLKFQI
jgi:hypothetical protein